jgi:hypothetical protein
MIFRIYAFRTKLTIMQKILTDFTMLQGSISYSIIISLTMFIIITTIHFLCSLAHVNPPFPIRRSLGTGQRGVLTAYPQGRRCVPLGLLSIAPTSTWHLQAALSVATSLTATTLHPLPVAGFSSPSP